jgi:putative phage-type endonuclease
VSPLSAAQKEMRRTGVSASDVSAIVGVNPWRSPLDVYCEKLGIAPEQPESAAMKAGNYLEPVIADWYADDRGIARSRLVEMGTVRHAEHEWMLCTPDRAVMAVDETSWSHGLECKTTGVNLRHDWGDGPDDVPDYYRTQCAWSMAVTGIDRWDLAVLIGGQDFRVYELHRDLELEAALIEKCKAFWFDHVVPGNPPPLDGSDAAKRLLAAKYPKHTDEVIHATPEFEALAQQLHAFKEAEARAAEDVARTEALLRDAIGDKASVIGSNWRASWRTTAGNGYDYKAIVEREAKVPREVIEKYRRPGTRRFDFRWKGDK